MKNVRLGDVPVGSRVKYTVGHMDITRPGLGIQFATFSGEVGDTINVRPGVQKVRILKKGRVFCTESPDISVEVVG